MSAVDPAVTAYRLEQNAKAIDRLALWRIETDKALTATALEVRELRGDLVGLGDQIASLKRVLIGLLVSITGGSVLLCISLLAATGHIG